MRAHGRDHFAKVRLCLGATLLITFAARRASAATPPPEVKQIDARCTAAVRLDDAHKGRLRVFADASGAVQPKANDDSGSWIPFRSVDDLKDYLQKNGGPNTQGEAWSAPDGTFIASVSFRSDTGAWLQQVAYCFRADNTLARSRAVTFNFVNDAEDTRIAYYAADGQVLFSTAKASGHKGKRRAALDGLDAPPVYPTVASLPFSKLVSGDLPPAASAAAPDGQACPAADGERDPNMVARYVKSQLPAVKGCYERELAKNRTLEGKVVMHWTIDHEGTIHDVTTEQVDPHIAQAVPCILDVVKKWRFPPALGGKVEVSFPFVFQSTEPDAGTAPSGAASGAPSTPTRKP
jgi:hypothetical protein